MKSIIQWVQKNPARVLALLQLILAPVLAKFGGPQLAATALGGFAIMLGIGVHSLVTPVTTMVTNVTQAATQAATQTAANLDQTVVGSVGEVTSAAQAIANNAVDKVLDGLLGTAAKTSTEVSAK